MCSHSHLVGCLCHLCYGRIKVRYEREHGTAVQQQQGAEQGDLLSGFRGGVFLRSMPAV